MNRRIQAKKAPFAKRTRTNRDWIMIILGVSLIVFLLISGYVSMRGTGEPPEPRKRGPVRDPKSIGMDKDAIRMMTQWGGGEGHLSGGPRDDPRNDPSDQSWGSANAQRDGRGNRRKNENPPQTGLPGLALPFPAGILQDYFYYNVSA